MGAAGQAEPAGNLRISPASSQGPSLGRVAIARLGGLGRGNVGHGRYAARADMPLARTSSTIADASGCVLEILVPRDSWLTPDGKLFALDGPSASECCTVPVSPGLQLVVE